MTAQVRSSQWHKLACLEGTATLSRPFVIGAYEETEQKTGDMLGTHEEDGDVDVPDDLLDNYAQDAPQESDFDTDTSADDDDDMANPILLEVFPEPALNEMARDFIKESCIGSYSFRSCKRLWAMMGKYSPFHESEYMSFDTVRRRVLNTLPKVKMYWTVLDGQTNSTIKGKGSCLPKGYSMGQRYTVQEVWSRMRLKDLLKFHVGLHPRKSDVYCTNGKLDYSKVSLDFSIDGVKCANSSSNTLYITSVRFNSCKMTYPIDSRYAVKEYKKNVNDFLKPLINQCNTLGIRVTKFLGDAPVRAMCKLQKQHGGFYSCECCDMEGVHLKKRVCYPPETMHCKIRTHKGWRQRVRERKNTHRHTFGIMGKSPLLDLPNFNIVFDSPSDPLHRDHMGITKATWRLTTNQGHTNLHRKNATKLQDCVTIDYLRVRLPSEFNHRSRPIDVANFKAHEWKALLLTCFPSIIKHSKRLQDEEIARLWGLYAFLVRAYLVDDEVYAKMDQDFLRRVHEDFYDTYSSVFGPEHCTFNVHNFYHMDLNRTAGRQHTLSTEPFESMYGDVKKSYAPGTSSIGKQFLYKMLMRRLDHKDSTCDYEMKIDATPPELRRDDSILVNNKWQFYKVRDVSQDRETIKVSRIFTDIWMCDVAPDLPFHKVGVKKLVSISNTCTDINRKHFTGKGAIYRDSDGAQILMGLMVDALFS